MISRPQPVPRLFNASLIVGGLWHDMDFARVELLQKLLAHEDVKTAVFQDFEATGPLGKSDFIIAYTCDLAPSTRATNSLRRWVAGGGRFFALHATNSNIRFLDDGRVSAPDLAPGLSDLLGTSFVAHPPLGLYRVEVTDPHHPLTAGLESFETRDEHYLLDVHADLHVLLDTHFEGETPRFERSSWPAARHPVFYIRRHGSGQVLYLTLGHCRGPYDMAPITYERRPVSRCSWELPVFHELLRRGICWAKEAVSNVEFGATRG